MTNKIVCWIFKMVWWRWFSDHRIIKVKSWNKAITVTAGGTRQTSQPAIIETIKEKYFR